MSEPVPPPAHLVVSLRTTPAPPDGVIREAYAWKDLLAGDPPSLTAKRAPRLCVGGPELVDGPLRVEMALIVTLTPLGSAVALEDRVCVTTRGLAGVIETEQEHVGARLEEAATRSAAAARFQQRRAKRLRREGGAPVALAWAAALRVYHDGAAALLGGLRRASRGVATLPDYVANRWRRTGEYLATPEGRRRLREGLVDPRNLSTRQKAVTLFVGLTGIILTTLLVHVVVTLAIPQAAVAWRRIVALFGYVLVTSLGPPFPLEPVLLAASLSIGPSATIGIALVAKVLAAWMVFFLGDEVNDRLRERAERSPRLARALALAERFASRYGVAATALFVATPGLPDVIALYVFGSLHMRLSRFLLGVTLGGLVLYSLLVLGVGALLGLH